MLMMIMFPTCFDLFQRFSFWHFTITSEFSFQYKYGVSLKYVRSVLIANYYRLSCHVPTTHAFVRTKIIFFANNKMLFIEKLQTQPQPKTKREEKKQKGVSRRFLLRQRRGRFSYKTQ